MVINKNIDKVFNIITKSRDMTENKNYSLYKSVVIM